MSKQSRPRNAARAVGMVCLLALVFCPLAVAQERSRSGLIESPIDETRSHVTTTEVRDALDLIAADIVSISFGTSSHAGFDVFDFPVSFFPANGNEFFVMSTGATTSVQLPNNAPDTSTELGGLNTSAGEDLVQVVLNLQPPSNASCLAFDFAFYSEEFPEFVGSEYNDAFIAEIGQSNFQIVSNQVIAPNNFAFDTANNVISINTVFGATAANANGTTYDGATSLLTAKTPLEPGGDPITVTLSIMDLGDSIYDSTAFIDNFRWLFGTACEPGADVDNDRDSLLDGWETNGIDFDNDGTVDLDLPAMGADPDHKDIFVEIDYMVLAGAAGHTHKPRAAALQILIDAFDAAPVDNPDGTQGIHIHIDAGSDTIMDPVTNALWGTRSESDVLTHQNNLGTATATGRYDWTAFDAIKGAGTAGSFDVRRADVFHYVIFAHNLAPTFGSTSGISRGIPASDLIVSLGGWTSSVGTVNEQGGTLMHELGHNLGLFHGGDDPAGNYEPNYLSIMNYAFQTRGLRIGGSDGNFDYSTFTLPVLDENALDETDGLMGVPAAAGYGTRFYDAGCTQRIVNDVNNPIDWNRDGDGGADTSVAEDINGSACGRGVGYCTISGEACFNNAHCSAGGGTCDFTTVLDNSDNWEEIIFNGGAVGHLGEMIELPMDTESIDIDEVEDSTIPTEFGVSITGPGPVSIKEGKSATFQYIVRNKGMNADTYAISTMEQHPWGDMSGVPATLVLGPGESATFSIVVTVPRKTLNDITDLLVVNATSMTKSLIMDSAETITTVIGPVALCHIPPDNPDNRHTITVGRSAVPSHLAHGDFIGVCGGATAGAERGPGRSCASNTFGRSGAHEDVVDEEQTSRETRPGTSRRGLFDPIRKPARPVAESEPTTAPRDELDRVTRRHLWIFTHPAATASAREASRVALIEALGRLGDTEQHLRIAETLVESADPSHVAELSGHLEVIRAEARRFEREDLLETADDLLDRLRLLAD